MSPLRPKFGARILNNAAGKSNPWRIGYYVETIVRKGRVMNPGTYLRLTDKHGDFWEHEANSGWLELLPDEEEAPDV